ncbi:MAG: pyridoxal-phosphate dependent enzyme, partial [Gammaproteobacteria bacterium]|nr:pyridoxal-phosphate dependent enzyme [Gammaproteobacteria bacterium]
KGAFLLHPYDHDLVIAGQGTACYEALATGLKPDAIFATCGGGGWLSGTFLAARLLASETLVFGAEPKQANDAAQSYRRGEIVHFTTSPETIADGARTLSVSARTFHYLRQLAGFYEIEERDIVYWTQWLTHLLKTTVEPTSAVAMAGAFEWLKHQRDPQSILVMLSGGNIAASAQARVWAADHLATPPRAV